MTDRPERDLQRLYLDWCSTQVAKRFLELSHDEVWLRSNFVASIAPDSDGAHAPDFVGLDRIPEYLEVVRKTALILASEMNLPSFAEWEKAYSESPRSFQTDILGL